MDSRADSLATEAQLWVHEKPSTCPGIPAILERSPPDLGELILVLYPSILLIQLTSGPELLSRRFHRINQLRKLKCVYAEDDEYKGYWFMVNATNFPPIPIQPWKEMVSDWISPPSLPPTVPQWLDATRPYLGFSPTYGANLGKILSSIRVPNAAIPHMVTKTPTETYTLDAPIASAWKSFEHTLERILYFLFDHLPNFPSPRGPRPPSAYGYSAEYPDRNSAIASVELARDAFDEMLVLASFGLAHWRFESHTYPLEGALSYFEKYYPDAYPTLYDLVADSCVGDFRTGTRAGYFIDLFNYPGDWIPYMHVWAEAGVPLWIYAGTHPTECVDNYQSESSLIPLALKDWMPSRLILAAAFGKFLSGVLKYAPPPPPAFEDQNVQGRTLCVPALKSFAVIQGDYEHGITPDEYFERKREGISRWASSRWMSKEAIAHAMGLGDCSQWRPRFLGYRMYVWECERGVWHRRVLDNAAKRVYFEIHAPSQRHWCPLAEEIDLCWWLDASVGEVDFMANSRSLQVAGSHHAPNVDTSMIYLPENTPRIQSIGSAPQTATLELRHSPSPRRLPSKDPSDASDFESVFDDPAPPTSAEEVAHPQIAETNYRLGQVDPRSWESVLSIRLGYDVKRPLPAWHIRRSKSLFANPQSAVSNVYKCLGHHGPLGNTLQTDSGAPAVDAINTLGSVGQYGRRLLPDRWDISPLCLDKPKLPSTLSAYQISYEGERGTIKRCVLATSTQPLKSQWWVFSMTGAALLQVLRSGETGMLAIGRYLISRGVPFHTTISVSSHRSSGPLQIARQGLGSLTSDDSFTATKYAHYETQRGAALAAGLGPLALKSGGIIWRLSVESATPRMVKDALRPPHAATSQRKMVCGTLGSQSFISDQFQPHELDMILGAYRMKKRLGSSGGKHGNGGKESAEDNWGAESVVFLWPTEYAWAASGLNIGEWSSECEAWYQGRLASLRAGTARPMSSTEWRASLRKLSAARAVWETYDALVHETFFDM